jgi:hypothetical protein
MKKFGTPMGAAPGSANEYEGLAGVGTPLEVVGGTGLGGGAGLGFGLGLGGAGLGGGGLGVVVVVPPWWEGAWDWPGPTGLGAVEPLGEVVVEGAVVVGVVVAGVGPGVVVVLVDVVSGVVAPRVWVVVVDVADGQDSLALRTGPGRLSEASGAPAGSWKYSVWPLIRMTVTVQLAAEALGMAPIAEHARTAHTEISPILNFPRLSTVVLTPPESSSALDPRRDGTATVARPSYWLL